MKPQISIEGQDGNVFAIIGACSRALKAEGFPELAKEMAEKVMGAESYDEALRIFTDYVEFV